MDNSWLRVSYETGRSTLNPKTKRGGILQKRWQSHELLYLEEKGRYWQVILPSELVESPLITSILLSDSVLN